jgi:hypothetical protein
MKRQRLPRAETWRESNPQYQSGGVRKVRIPHRETGELIECCEFDGALLWDRERDNAALAKGRKS